MSFLSLSTELIEKIASCLRAQDIAVLRLCCRRIHLIVEGSLLLQYLYRMEQAGVYDPLWDLPGRPIIDRLETLERWETSWNDIGKYLVTPRLVIPAERDLFGPFFLCDDYLFAVDWQGHPTGLRQPALLYVDLRDALRTGQHRWKQIDYPPGSIAITQAFSIEEDDLVVSVLSLPRVDSAPTSTVLRFMSLETGGAHPLAKLPDLRLDTQLPVSLLDVRADVIGDQIVLVLVDLRNDAPESDAIYLVDWKQGLMSLVHRAPNGTYEGALSVLSPELVLFLKRESPSIELCRVTRGTAQTPPSLRVVRTLALPPFHVGYHVHTAYMQTDRHSARRRGTPLQRPASPLPFHSAPDDMVVGITFLLRQHGPQMTWKKVVTTISHRALFALAAAEGDDGDGEGEGEGSGDDNTTPWEEWGPSAARVIAPSSFQWITAHAGQRWLSLEADRLVIRDFSAVRVRRAAAAARDGGSDRGVGTVSELPPTETIIRGGSTCFAHDVASALPFVETRVEAPTREHSMVLTDGERLVAFVRVTPQGQPPTFDIHVLEESDVSSSSAGSCSSHSQSRTAALGGKSYQLA
ncbi:hypothetical protein H4582DRAFT_108072 [Lactarius indigo]|nr:hypothetical protein H4582DRAFT_108072 [Lactarius indigo]